MCGCLSHAPQLGIWHATQACSLDWELNPQPFGLQACIQYTESYQPGQQYNFKCEVSNKTLKNKIEKITSFFPSKHAKKQPNSSHKLETYTSTYNVVASVRPTFPLQIEMDKVKEKKNHIIFKEHQKIPEATRTK